MRIYRVEYANGLGPYNPFTEEEMDLGEMDAEVSVIRDRIMDAHGWDAYETHPAPARRMREDERCGFKSMRDLFRWFGGYLPQIIAVGGRVVTYDVSRINYSDEFQVVFTMGA